MVSKRKLIPSNEMILFMIANSITSPSLQRGETVKFQERQIAI